jgi:hypothetical protein
LIQLFPFSARSTISPHDCLCLAVDAHMARVNSFRQGGIPHPWFSPLFFLALFLLVQGTVQCLNDLYQFLGIVFLRRFFG